MENGMMFAMFCLIVGFVGMNMNMTYSFAELIKIIPHFIAEKIPILMRAGHGVGKSSLTHQLADALNKAEYRGITDWYVIDKRLAQLTEGDTVGMPDRDAMCNNVRVTKFNPPEWFLIACTRPVILLLDEVDRAVHEVAMSVFQLLDSRKMGEYKLHPDTVVIACINGGIHNGSNKYSVRGMDPAEIDRWAIFDVMPTSEDWFNWARGSNVEMAMSLHEPSKKMKDNRIHPVLIEFLSEYGALLDPVANTMEANKKYPSRRSWERCSNALGNLLDNPAENAGDILLIAGAIVGNDAAQTLAAKCKEIKKDLTAVEVLVDGQRLVKDMENVQYMRVLDGLPEVFQKLQELEKEVEEKECKNLTTKFYDNLAEYFAVCPREIGVKVAEAVISRCCGNSSEGEDAWKYPAIWSKVGSSPPIGQKGLDPRYHGGKLGGYFLPMDDEVKKEEEEKV